MLRRLPSNVSILPLDSYNFRNENNIKRHPWSGATPRESRMCANAVCCWLSVCHCQSTTIASCTSCIKVASIPLGRNKLPQQFIQSGRLQPPTLITLITHIRSPSPSVAILSSISALVFLVCCGRLSRAHVYSSTFPQSPPAIPQIVTTFSG